MSRIFRLQNVPPVSTYVRGLTLLADMMTDTQRACLTCLYSAPQRTATVPHLASLVGASSYQTINAQVGRLGRLFCEAMNLEPDMRPSGSPRLWAMWSQGWNHPEGFHWQMLPEVAEALEALGWISEGELRLAEEVVGLFLEGAVRRVMVNAYERNQEARKRCIEYWGLDCVVCGFNFGLGFGEIGEGFIHVHHLREISSIGRQYAVDPVKDLRPVCPNCHAMLHSRVPALSIEELKGHLR